MSTLEIATKVAAHPRVMQLRAQQQHMVRKLNQDYGPNFMDAVDSEVSFEGINRWTPRQKAEYEALNTRLSAVRTALRTFYTNH